MVVKPYRTLAKIGWGPNILFVGITHLDSVTDCVAASAVLAVDLYNAYLHHAGPAELQEARIEPKAGGNASDIVRYRSSVGPRQPGQPAHRNRIPTTV